MKKKKRTQKTHTIIILCMMFIVFIIIPFTLLKVTENGTFYVVDFKNNEVLTTYKHYSFAKYKMDHLNNPSICIKNENDQIICLKSGIVNLKTKAITENTTYITDDQEEGYTNGNYGADALYLGTNNDGTKVHFKISGQNAWTDIHQVELYPYDESLYLSTYTVSDQVLTHTISTDLINGNVNPLEIGIAPKELEENTTYYSYDGHYFYKSFEDMINNKPINTTPYYNYYQYVPHRTLSQMNDYNTYLEKIGITKQATTYPCLDDESILYDQENAFIDAQNKYGINATMMFALALNESGYGKSQYAIEYNNLFGHAAIDNNPDQANQYRSIQECIEQHAYNFLQQGYANPNDYRYHGSWFGDKASGINVNYASDPYWGEKAASFFFHLEKQQTNTIKTIQLSKDLNVYAENKKDILYSYEKGDIVSICIETEKNGWYIIKSEAPVSNNVIDIQADYDHSVGYIDINDFK